MPLALRPYATAGIALVGAGVIAVTPVAAPPPEIQSHSVQLTAAVDNPVDVFTPVFEKAAAFIQTTIANETANPLPIVNAVIAKGTADAQTLGEIAEALAPVVKAVILNFPPTAAAALQKAAAGDLDGAMSTFVPLFIGPVIGGFQQYMKLTDLVRGEFEVVARLAEATMYQAWGTALGTALAGFTVATTTAAGIEAVGTAIVSGDPANVVNAAQHSVANIASAGISAVDTTINLNVALARQAFAKAINPPPRNPRNRSPWRRQNPFRCRLPLRPLKRSPRQLLRPPPKPLRPSPRPPTSRRRPRHRNPTGRQPNRWSATARSPYRARPG